MHRFNLDLGFYRNKNGLEAYPYVNKGMLLDIFSSIIDQSPDYLYLAENMIRYFHFFRNEQYMLMFFNNDKDKSHWWKNESNVVMEFATFEGFFKVLLDFNRNGKNFFPSHSGWSSEMETYLRHFVFNSRITEDESIYREQFSKYIDDLIVFLFQDTQKTLSDELELKHQIYKIFSEAFQYWKYLNDLNENSLEYKARNNN